jgi:hypothetical protein
MGQHFITALVMLMTPGVALFYSGMVRRKNILSTLMMSFMCLGLVGLLWVIGHQKENSRGDAPFMTFLCFIVLPLPSSPSSRILLQLIRTVFRMKKRNNFLY